MQRTLARVHGYEPPKQTPEGSWGDIASLTMAVFSTIFLPPTMVVGVLALVVAILVALFSNPVLALIPAAGLALLVLFFVRRDKRLQAEARRDIDSH